MLELGVPKIYVGSSKCAKHTQHANSRGVWGHAPPGKLGIRRLNLGAFLVDFAVNKMLSILIHA